MKEGRLFRTVIFDFDYTLADSSRGAIKCVNQVLSDMDFPQASPDAVCRLIGVSLTGIFRELTGRESAEQTQEFIRLFEHYADQYMADLTVLFPTTAPAARALKRQGKNLGIVSTKFRYRIEGILKRDGLDGIFDVIVGGEDVAIHKPDPAGLLQAIRFLQTPPEVTLYTGDSVVDAETAVRADVPFLAVLSGVTEREAFEGYPIIGAMENLSYLPAWLKNSDHNN
ncbi:MAG: HAD-IA family hydrolase [Deltaproteobacteria bacterium]|nr:HAD-IA family hydrolase [Deltaproteobacteria bacterium]